MMEYIWSDEQYRQRFVDISHNIPEEFSSFCNFLINDTNSLLFEGLLNLGEIKNHEEMKDDPQLWGSLGEEERQQAEQHYHDESRKAKMNMQLSNMVIQLLAQVTKNCPDFFVSSDLGEKFSQAVNFCLDQLTTQKGLKFKIKSPERFHFEPKELLINLIAMYVNMGHLEKFRQNCVTDARSYSDETFEKAVSIVASSKKNVQVDPEI